MRRDIHLIRKILLRVEAADGILPVSQMEDLADLPTVARHVEWLAEAGLLKVEHLIPEAIDAAFDAIILRQTWQACEFLDAARDEHRPCDRAALRGRARPFQPHRQPP